MHPKEEVPDVAEIDANNYAEPLDTFESTYKETDSDPSSDSDENLSQRRKRKVKSRKSKRKDAKHKTDAGSNDEMYPDVSQDTHDTHDTTHVGVGSAAISFIDFRKIIQLIIKNGLNLIKVLFSRSH